MIQDWKYANKYEDNNNLEVYKNSGVFIKIKSMIICEFANKVCADYLLSFIK